MTASTIKLPLERVFTIVYRSDVDAVPFGKPRNVSIFPVARRLALPFFTFSGTLERLMRDGCTKC